MATETGGRNGRPALIATITLSVAVAGLIFTLIWREFDALSRRLQIHEALPHHAQMGEQMAAVRQQQAEQDLKTADRFTRTDWNAAVKWILALFDHVDHRLESIEGKHPQDHKSQDGPQ